MLLTSKSDKQIFLSISASPSWAWDLGDSIVYNWNMFHIPHNMSKTDLIIFHKTVFPSTFLILEVHQAVQAKKPRFVPFFHVWLTPWWAMKFYIKNE